MFLATHTDGVGVSAELTVRGNIFCRYREMEYLLDILYKNDRFELMLTKMVRPDSPQEELELKTALRDYLSRRHPEDKEKLEMLSLHFSMFREIGENLSVG